MPASPGGGRAGPVVVAGRILAEHAL